MTALDDYGPYDAGVGANRTEDFWRDFMRHVTGSGVIAGVTNEFAVTQHSGGDQTVDVATGECFLRGQWGESTSLKNIALSAAHATLARIDRIVLRNDFTANTISIEVLEGTPNATPTIPALTQSSSRWEEGLARIARAANDNIVGTADITDERTFLTFAGITGLPIKPTVRAASITNVTLATACEAGDTFGGVTLAYGDRIGLFGQTTASENGIYVVNQTGAPSRAPDADTSTKLKPNTLVGVSEGTLADKWYQLTTNAPIVLGTTSQVWAEFGAGSSGAFVGCRAVRTTNQAIANATHTAISLNAADIFDTDGFHDPASNPSRVTIPAGKGGYYRLSAWALIAPNAAGDRIFQFLKNGVTGIGATKAGALNTGTAQPLHVESTVLLAAGDYVEVFVYQDFGGSLDIVTASLTDDIRFDCIRVGV